MARKHGLTVAEKTAKGLGHCVPYRGTLAPVLAEVCIMYEVNMR